jgi:tungstate transport system substrate-binding protein
MEQSYWKAAGVERAAMSAYVSAGLGMGEVLMMAAEMRGYTLTDRATFAAYRAKTGLEILVSGDPRLFNPYGVIAVNPARHPDVNHAGAMQFIEWLTSAEGQAAIAAFRVGGEQLFFPNGR